LVEFTGERVIPGQVNEDLWSEHIARYAFARRYVRTKRVLDAGCGTGYGTAELAQDAASVIGLDLSTEALEYARVNYPLPNIAFVAGSGLLMPFTESSFDAVIAFEVIEHLNEYPLFIAECARVLKRDGLFIVSTPNTRYYAESRASTGPNPYHQHEFEASEFHRALSTCFRHVTLLLQNRVESFAFHPAKTFWPADARVEGGGGSTDDAHFFIALCTRGALPDLRSFVYVPRAANVLREREQHVVLLEKELAQAKAWLRQTEQERDGLLSMFQSQKDELEARNRWAAQLNEQVATTQARVVELQNELTREQAAAAEVAAGYETKVQELENEGRAKTQWAMDTEARLSTELQEKCTELAECARLLDESQALVEERTRWAQRVDTERTALETQLNLIRASRWQKLGRKLGLGPQW
jgi:ubiquinone/menaquinone biosynthesis C-methylase UbiE